MISPALAADEPLLPRDASLTAVGAGLCVQARWCRFRELAVVYDCFQCLQGKQGRLLIHFRRYSGSTWLGRRSKATLKSFGRKAVIRAIFAVQSACKAQNRCSKGADSERLTSPAVLVFASGARKALQWVVLLHLRILGLFLYAGQFCVCSARACTDVAQLYWIFGHLGENVD